MKIIDKNFKDHKAQALAKLNKALNDDKVDQKIISLLKKINSLDSYFTTSSCAGRIVVLQLPKVGDKKHAVFLGKWHREVSISELVSAIEKHDRGQIWLLSQPPIFHVGCSSLEVAGLLMNLGISCGFKHSGIRSVSSQIIVELQSTERIDMPLGEKDKIKIPGEMYSFLIKIANEAVIRAQKKINRLEKEIKKQIE